MLFIIKNKNKLNENEFSRLTFFQEPFRGMDVSSCFSGVTFVLIT